MTDVNWPDVWGTVYRGFYRHKNVLESAQMEWKTLRQQGYGDPLDGFISAALHAHEWEIASLEEAFERKDAEGLYQVLIRVMLAISRYYSEADLDWSTTWEEYQNEYYQWIDAIRQYILLGNEDMDAFIDYTTRKWRI